MIQYVKITEAELKRLQLIEKKYKELQDMTASFYPDDENEKVGDLCDMGEKLAMHFGYL